MEYNAFQEGTEPGSLKNTNEIGILLCYILDKTEKPLTKDELIGIIQNYGMANYFETTSALSELINNGNVITDPENDQFISLSDNGKMISSQLNRELPLSIRQKALSATISLAKQRRIEAENPVVITKDSSGGYNVNMRITDGMRDLMSVSLFVPDKREASLVKKNFHNDPSRLYSVLLAVVTEDNELIKQTLEELKNE